MAIPPAVVDLTLLDSDDECPARTTRRSVAAPPTLSNSGLEIVCSVPAHVSGSSRRASQAPGGAAASFHASRAQPEAANGDDDVVLVGGSVGQVAGRDLPHLRPDCADNAFARGVTSSSLTSANAQHCAKCYCYVCDVPASRCTMFTNDVPERAHCNAFKSATWDRLRNLAKQGAAGMAQVRAVANGEKMPGPSTAAALQPSRFSLADAMFSSTFSSIRPPAAPHQPPTAHARTNASAPSSSQHKPPAPARTSKPDDARAPGRFGGASRLPLPNPAADPAMIELGSFSIPVKAVKGTTIAQLQSKVARTGFYETYATADDGRLSLKQLFDRRRNEHGGFSTHLHLKPVVSIKTKSKPVDTRRVREVTVIDCVGRRKPIVMGATVHNKCHPADVISALTPQLQPPMEDGEQLLLAHTSNRPASYSYPELIVEAYAADDILDDDKQRRRHVYLYRMPKDPSGRPPIQHLAASTDSSEDAKIQLCPRFVSVWLRSVSSDSTYGGWLQKAPLPLFLPLARGGGDGGSPDLHASLVASLQQALRPMRRPTDAAAGGSVGPSSARGGHDEDDEPPSKKIKVESGAAAERVKIYKGHVTMSVDRSESQRLDKPHVRLRRSAASVGEPSSHAAKPAGYIAPVTAVWQDADGQRHPYRYSGMLYGSDGMAVHPSALPAALKETIKRMEAQRQRMDEKHDALRQVHSVISDLVTASQRTATGQPRPHTHPATCAVVVDLEADPAHAGDARRGIARFTVYTWKVDAGVRGTSSLFQAWDNTTRERDISGFVTRIVGRIVKDAPEPKAMARQISDASKLADSVTSIDKLLASLESGERGSADDPPGLTVQLRPYQKQSLAFMLETEARTGGYRELFWLKRTNSDGSSYFFSPLLQSVSLEVPPLPSSGFLAEEMGLGKTVEVLALVLSAPAPMSVVAGALDSVHGGRMLTRATLVVCAVSLVGQWVDEAKSKCNLKILSYHGQGRLRDVSKIACDYDLVVTTYQTLASDFGAAGRVEQFAPLGRVHWHRIVFDEGHMVKNSTAVQSKACVALSSDRRWCCTGTPISTALDDLYGQLAVVQMVPLSCKPFFDKHIKHSLSGRHRHAASSFGLQGLLYTLHRCMIRHTKQQVLGGERVLQLPPMTQTDMAVDLSASEQALYQRVHEEVSRKWGTFRAGGAHVVNRYQMSIMALLGPLRRICSGGRLRDRDVRVPDLGLDMFAGPSHTASTSGGSGGVPASLTPDPSLVSPEAECSICLDSMENPVVTPCNHWFCKDCISGWLSNHSTCSLCRAHILSSGLRLGVMPDDPAAAAAAAAGGGGGGGSSGAGTSRDASSGGDGAPPEADVHVCESKLQALVAELRAMRAADPTAKALVFSQYTITLSWLQQRLTEEGFGYRTISGSMPMKQRAKAIEAFQKDPPTTVFLLSMRSGAVGINLTAASHVFIMEPCLNPALEEQAIGRSWRMGQTREVVVKRFFTRGSVEQAIIDVVKARRSAEVVAGATAPVSTGNLRQDKQELRMSELDALFAAPQFTVAATTATGAAAR